MSNTNVALGDLLKAEADQRSRIAIDAPKGTLAGQPVLFEPRGQYLIALSDEVRGQVLVQPHNCTIYIDNIDDDALSAVSVDVDDESGGTTTAPLTVEMLKQQGDTYGIKYITTERE